MRQAALALGIGLLLPGAFGSVARAAGHAGGSEQLSYKRILRGSKPEYIFITVNSDGTGTYDGRQLTDPPEVCSMKLSQGAVQKLFSLAAGLNGFRGIDLESHKKVADLGQKTFTFEKDGQKSSAEFNYTLNKKAQELADTFEKIATVEQHIQALQFAIKYDHLGLPHQLTLIQIDLDNQALAEPELMVPTLEEIARNPRFMHLAQVRAQDILARVQGPNP